MKKDEIIKYLVIDECKESDKSLNTSINIILDKRNLKLLKELHGDIGMDEFIRELSDIIKTELQMGL